MPLAMRVVKHGHNAAIRQEPANPSCETMCGRAGEQNDIGIKSREQLLGVALKTCREHWTRIPVPPCGAPSNIGERDRVKLQPKPVHIEPEEAATASVHHVTGFVTKNRVKGARTIRKRTYELTETVIGVVGPGLSAARIEHHDGDTTFCRFVLWAHPARLSDIDERGVDRQLMKARSAGDVAHGEGFELKLRHASTSCLANSEYQRPLNSAAALS